MVTPAAFAAAIIPSRIASGSPVVFAIAHIFFPRRLDTLTVVDGTSALSALSYGTIALAAAWVQAVVALFADVDAGAEDDVQAAAPNARLARVVMQAMPRRRRCLFFTTSSVL